MTLQSHFDISSLKRLPPGKRRRVVEDLLSSLSTAEKAKGLYDWVSDVSAFETA
jgi:hypothetical protein